MSAMGHEQTSRHVRVISVILLKADIRQRIEHVCFVPIAKLKFGTLAWLTNAWLAPGVKIIFSLFEGLGLYTC